MKKKNKKYLIGIIVIIAIIGIIIFLNSDKNPTSLDVIYLDSNGNQIINNLAIVSGANQVSAIAFKIKVRDIGTTPLTCNLISGTINGATDTNFDTTLSLAKSTPLYIESGVTKSWTTSALDINYLTSLPTPDFFEFTVRCYFTSGTDKVYLPYSKAGKSLNILSESTKVNFRTTDLTYSDSSAIAYTNICNNTLTQYGEYGGSHDSGPAGYCMENMPNNLYCGKPTFVMYVPGGWWNGGDGINTGLWKGTTNERVCICTDFPNIINHQYTLYTPTDSDRTKVSNSPDKTIPFDSREVYC